MRPMKTIPLLLAATFACALPILAQVPVPDANAAQKQDPRMTDTEEKHHYWDASLPTGSFLIPLDRIVAISLHQYAMDNGLIVSEVVIDTVGQVVNRFYYIAPATENMSGSGTARSLTGIVERGREILDRNAQKVGTNLHEMVIKQYPTTTHAHTVEYRLLDERDLRALLGSVRAAWTSGKGRKFTIK